jgi:hypothetical protein
MNLSLVLPRLSLTIIGPDAPIASIRNSLHRIREQCMETARQVLEAYNRELDRLLVRLHSAQTLAQAVASTWVVRQFAYYMAHIGDDTKASLVQDCDREIDQMLATLIRTDPIGFDCLEQAVRLIQQEQSKEMIDEAPAHL